MALLLPHLIADFPLQPTWLVRLKRRSWVGLALHVSVHGVITALLIANPSQYGKVLLVLLLSHFAIDWLKLHLPDASPSVGFVLDQVAHGAVLWGLTTLNPTVTSVVSGQFLLPLIAIAAMPAISIFGRIVAAEYERTSSLRSMVQRSLSRSHERSIPSS